MRHLLRVCTPSVILLAWLAPPHALAQVTFADVAPRLPRGHRTVLTVDGRPLVGELVRATADGLTLWRYDTGGSEDVTAARISAITYDDSLANGALIGAVSGAVPGFIAGLGVQRYCRNESSSSCNGVPFSLGGVAALIGLGVGAGVDGLLKTTVRFGPPRPSAPSAAVILRPDRRRPMALVAIAF